MFFRMWALLLSKLLQFGICRVRILSVGWHFYLEGLGSTELDSEGRCIQNENMVFTLYISLQFLSEM